MKSFSIIVAMDEARGIGKAGDLAWRLSADLKHFKKITSTSFYPGQCNAVIMGRKTWESLPLKFRPLPDRINVVITANPQFILPQGVISSNGLVPALELLGKDSGVGEVFVIGGANVYAQAIALSACQRLYLTQVQGQFNCDAFFPSIPESFQLASAGSWLKEGDIAYRFIEFHKKA